IFRGNNKNKGNIESMLFSQAQRRNCLKVFKWAGAQDEVEGWGQPIHIIALCNRTFKVDLEASLLKDQEDILGVRVLIFDKQEMEWSGHDDSLDRCRTTAPMAVRILNRSRHQTPGRRACHTRQLRAIFQL